MTKTSFLICPVRGVDPEDARAFVSRIENEGYCLHWPPRDTKQDDPIGLRICRDNMAAIKAADVVHVIWDGKSQGCLFDLGMAFALEKPIIPLSLPDETDGKSFQNMVRAWVRVPLVAETHRTDSSGSTPRDGFSDPKDRP